MSVAESFKERAIGVALLGEFDFPTGMEQVWSGLVVLQSVSGRDWRPIGDFGVISMPEVTDGFQSNDTVIGLRRAAEDNRLDYAGFVAAANADRALDVSGRDFTIYTLTFRTDTGQPYGDPVVELAGQMSHIRTVREGVSGYTIELVCSPYFIGGHLPSAGYMTAEDQRMRFPGDAGLDLIPNSATRTVTWPRG